MTSQDKLEKPLNSGAQLPNLKRVSETAKVKGTNTDTEKEKQEVVTWLQYKQCGCELRLVQHGCYTEPVISPFSHRNS